MDSGKEKGGEDDHDHENQSSRKRDKEPWKNHNRSRPKQHPPPDAPQTQVAQPRPNAASPAVPVDPVVHDVPSQAQPKAETDREAMMRYLVKNHPRPQLGDKDTDIRVECGPLTWFLHRQVLQTCPFFADLFPPPGPPNGIDNVIKLHGHVPEQLANVLYFMYCKEYPGADYDPKDPLIGDSVLTNTAMYLAGASVGYQDMMLFAVRKIEAWSAAVLAGRAQDRDRRSLATDNKGDGETGNIGVGIDIKADIGFDNLGPLQRAVQRQYDGTMDYALLRLADPLRRSLRIVYEQPPEVRQGLLLSLRLALVRFVDVALPYLATNESFRAHFRNEWMQPLTVAASLPGGGYGRIHDLADKGDGVQSEHQESRTRGAGGSGGACQKTGQTTEKTEKTEKTLAENVLMDHTLFQELGMLRWPYSPSSPDKRLAATATAPADATATAKEKTNTKTNAEAKPKAKEAAQATQAELPLIAYLFDLLHRLANIEQWGRHANSTTSKAANGGDGRRDRGSRGDRRDWRLRVGEAQCEHRTVMRELEHALRGVFDKVGQGGQGGHYQD
ncbi:hypothetical protein F503_08338 [Ophiostoma piceae UAMH 11346]|uniref:BTB domain-containing protein n=1 Tax=Ophiostoma piceae (strain UAMH 11346) TaxID=1262450 RepID=S3BZ60_OPHP1|nr:hypothetical protein F503_08338 [Ophiostoma piceae UAMH 11346]